MNEQMDFIMVPGAIAVVEYKRAVNADRRPLSTRLISCVNTAEGGGLPSRIIRATRGISNN